MLKIERTNYILIPLAWIPLALTGFASFPLHSFKNFLEHRPWTGHFVTVTEQDKNESLSNLVDTDKKKKKKKNTVQTTKMTKHSPSQLTAVTAPFYSQFYLELYFVPVTF